MLKLEVAQKKLAAVRIKNWSKERLEVIAGLPAELRTVGRLLLDRNAEGKPFKDWQKRIDARQKAQDSLGKMSAKDRQRLFAVLFPKLSATMEAAWQMHQKLPYEVDYDRKGFRAPNVVSIQNEARMGWLTQLISDLDGFDQDIVWCAAWAPHLSGGYGGDSLGILLAAALDARDAQSEEVFEILKDSASNQHEIGSMGRHVTRAMLVSSRPEAWEFAEKLLLAAQRQEGLRQVILESVDEAHPEAFRRMLRLVLEHNLIRFSSVVRAIDVWFGLQWSALTPAVLKKTVEQMLQLLDDQKKRAEVLAGEKGEELFFALWATAFEDAEAAIAPAVALLKDPSVERRYVGVYFLEMLGLPEGKKHLIEAIDDEDPRIAVKALEACPEGDDAPDLWDAILRLLERMPSKRQEGEAILWPWDTVTLDRKSVAGQLVDRLGKRPATALLPFIGELESWQRGHVVEALAKMKKWDEATRDTLFSLTGDRDSWVREKALAALRKCEVTQADAQRIEGLLVRKGSEMRQGVLRLLVKQKTPLALESVDRLLASKKAPQRLGGLELVRMLVEKKKAVAECRQRGEEYRQKYPQVSEDEELHLDAILDVHREKPTLDNALKLMDPQARSKAPEPIARKVQLCTEATIACMQSLDELIKKNAKTPIQIKQWGNEEEELLGNVSWGFPDPDSDKPALEDAKSRLPLFEMWEEWYRNRPKKLQDKDGLELVRAFVWWNIDANDWKQRRKQFGKDWSAWLELMINGQTLPKLKHPMIVGSVVQWLLRLHPPAGAVEFLLDAVETGFAHVPEQIRTRVVNLQDWNKRQRDWRMSSPVDTWWEELENYGRLIPDILTGVHKVRLWQLAHWRDQPAPGVGRVRPDLEYLVAGFEAGLANEQDVYDHLIGPGEDDFNDLRQLTFEKNEYLTKCPALAPLVERIRERVLEIELKRGEMPTAATGPAQAIMWLPGTPHLLRVLGVLGSKAFARGTYGEGRLAVLTHLVEVTGPRPEDTPERFASDVAAAGISRERLLELAFVTPAWVEHVERAVGWPGLKEGVWWYLAHMPGAHQGIGNRSDEDEDFDDDDDFGEDMDEGDGESSAPRIEKLDPWEKLIRERTPLTLEQRESGAVDPAWFHRVYATLGNKRWECLSISAKFGCSGQGHKKAIRLSEVLLGRAKKSELISDVRDRKLKESVRLLGLLPLPEGEKRDPELLSRYKVLVEYRRYTRTLSPMSREDAERTATIGLENLALTAGYPDPIRLEWAMEARQIADLAAGPVSVTQDGVTVTLAITPDAQPELTIQRGEKTLKAIPPAVRKHPRVAALAERRTDLKRQASRVRQSLEAMLVRGDTFSGKELRQLAGHPLLRPLLERLVILGEGIAGYPIADGQALEDHAGKREPVKPDETLRLAHPYDLFHRGDWDRWQSHLFRAERVQPFKQVFRELYVVTKQEKEDGTTSHRYAGQQVNPRQAMALWGSRGWTARDDVSKTFHREKLTVEVTFRHHGWTAAEVEGLTLEGIVFRRLGEYQPMPLVDVPPVLFSEVMRDCDLVVSVAHVGGVDPEASASTVQMREALLRETCGLLGIDNYKVQKSHILISGKLGNYSVHLGSGVVHRMPGGHVCIVPVHSQHRGRLFLPFADDDPRTAEVLSKVLLLARDHEIQDPSILDQLR